MPPYFKKINFVISNERKGAERRGEEKPYTRCLRTIQIV